MKSSFCFNKFEGIEKGRMGHLIFLFGGITVVGIWNGSILAFKGLTVTFLLQTPDRRS